MKDEIYKDPSKAPEERAEDLLGQMTIEEKVRQLQCLYIQEVTDSMEAVGPDGLGGFAFERVKMAYSLEEEVELLNRIQRYCVEETRLGIPALVHAEALHGLCLQKATSFPQAIGLAATWDIPTMEAVSGAIAEETRARGLRQVLSPTVDIARDVRWGRIEETYGEDPYLVSRMAVAFCKSFEERGIVTTPKHFVANSADGGRDSHPVYYSERLLRKVYFKPYEACIKEAGSQSIMASYNAYDGTPTGLNRWLLTDILRDEWGFKGFVVTDYGLIGKVVKNHRVAENTMEASIKAVCAGLEREIPTMKKDIGYSTLIKGIQEKLLDEKVLDDAVRRVLEAKFRIGLFENPYASLEGTRRYNNCMEHRQVAYKAAQKSIVLLKNENDVLPISKKVRKIAVLGSIAKKPRLGGYSSWDIDPVSIFKGLEEKCPEGTTIHFIDTSALGQGDAAAMEPVPAEYLQCLDDAKMQSGLFGRYRNNRHLSFQPQINRRDPGIQFAWGSKAPVQHEAYGDGKPFSVEWSGWLVPPKSGMFQLGIEANGSVRLFVDGELLIDRWEDPIQDTEIISCDLEAGKSYTLMVQYGTSGGDAEISLVWSMGGAQEEGTEVLKQQLEGSDVALITAGIVEGEGKDRAHLELPASMERLIENVSKTGIPTVVAISAGSAVTMSRWFEKVQSILYLWYPGQEGGYAAADVLLGRYNPAGRLPITFPQDVAQAPLYYIQEPSGRLNGYVDLSEKPLFPFGYGMSYTRFEYGEACLSANEIGSSDSVEVSVEVTNVGEVDGEEVIQLYICDLISSVASPLKELKDFTRIFIPAGESRRVTFWLTEDKLALLDQQMNWVVEPGEFEVMLGTSSEDIRTRIKFRVIKD